MYRPPPDPRYHRSVDDPAPRSVLASYVAAAATLSALWIASRPVAGTVALAVTAGLFAGVRRLSKLVRCFHDCGGFALDLGGTVRVCVTRPRTDGPGCSCVRDR